MPLMDLIMKRIRIISSQQSGPEYLYEALVRSARKVKTIVETYRWQGSKHISALAGR